MNLLWDLYWPALVAAAVLGVLSGAIGLRTRRVPRPDQKRRRNLAMAVGIGAVVLLAWAWHDPVGTGARFTTSVEAQSRQALINYEMEPIQTRVERSPLRRTLVLAGPADDFQRSELVRILDEVPGVSRVRWSNMPASSTLPLLVEVELAALLSFGVGLLLAYLLELRRRSNAQWRW